MRILYFSQYFPPETGATQIRAYEMATGLVRAGHRVTMICEFPNHPHGVIPAEYKGKLFERAELDGIDVIRVWVKSNPKKTYNTRLAFYVSYMLAAIVAGLFLARGKYDAIYATSPPLFVGGAGLLVSLLRRTPFFFEVRDLWPESAVKLGQLSRPQAIRWATWLEERCYARAQKIIVVVDHMLRRLTERGIAPDKLKLIRNGANTDLFRPDPDRRQEIRAELGLNGNFLVLYAGLHGLVYDLVAIMDVAAMLKDHRDIKLLFVGDGPTKAATVARAEELALDNVIFLPTQPIQRIAGFFNAADVTLAPLRKPQMEGAFPVKVYDSMASEVPVILCAEPETTEIVLNNRAGLVTDSGDYEAIREAILTLYQDPQLRLDLGRNGRQAVLRHYSRQAQAAELATLLAGTLLNQ